MRVYGDDGAVVFDAAWEARSFSQRLKGLMGRKKLAPGEAVFFQRCSSVHCLFMRIPIDVVSLDGAGRVLGVETVRPWRRVRRAAGCASILECAAGAAAAGGIVAGASLGFGGDDDARA